MYELKFESVPPRVGACCAPNGRESRASCGRPHALLPALDLLERLRRRTSARTSSQAGAQSRSTLDVLSAALAANSRASAFQAENTPDGASRAWSMASFWKDFNWFEDEIFQSSINNFTTCSEQCDNVLFNCFFVDQWKTFCQPGSPIGVAVFRLSFQFGLCVDVEPLKRLQKFRLAPARLYVQLQKVLVIAIRPGSDIRPAARIT